MNLPELDLIVQQLRSEDNRWEAIIELKIKGNASWIPSLIPLLKDNEWIVRWAVAEKLGDIGDKSAIRPLLQSLVDKDFHVAKNAHKALSRFGTDIVHDAIKLLGHKNVYLRQKVMELLRGLGEPILPLLKEEVDTAGWVVANRLIHLIWTIGKGQSENILISALGNLDVQKNVIILLGILKSKPAIPHFILLYSQKPSARRLIFQAIKLTGAKACFSILVEALDNSALAPGSDMMLRKIGGAAIPFLVQGLAINTDSHKIESILEKIDIEKSISVIQSTYKNNAVMLKKMKHFTLRHVNKTTVNGDKKGFFDSLFKI
jgi:HEAT repeat protein